MHAVATFRDEDTLQVVIDDLLQKILIGEHECAVGALHEAVDVRVRSESVAEVAWTPRASDIKEAAALQARVVDANRALVGSGSKNVVVGGHLPDEHVQFAGAEVIARVIGCLAGIADDRGSIHAGIHQPREADVEIGRLEEELSFDAANRC